MNDINYILVDNNFEFSKNHIQEINKLYKQLSTNPEKINASDISSVTKSSFLVLALYENKIIGIGILCPTQTFGGCKLHIEELVVDTRFRGKGAGYEIMKILIEKSKSLGGRVIELTSNPKRESANKLYQQMGFTLWETNPYLMPLK